VAESKTRQPRASFSLTANSPGRGATSRVGIGTALPPPSRASHQGAKFLLKVGQYLCLLLAFVCLGRVALDYSRARIFQSYQSWRFDRIIGHQPPSPKTLLGRWMDRAFSALNEIRGATLNLNRVQSNAHAAAGRVSVPAISALPPGSLVGRMDIPKIGITVMVLEGDGDDVLGKAAGHVPTTAFPGGPGNVVIAGHRDTFFRALRKIRRGDEITFTTTQGIYHYQVGSIEKVGPRDVQVLKASDHPTLTLITCYPFNYVGPAPMRFVVQASETGSSQIGGPDQLVASALPAQGSPSGVRSIPYRRPKEARLNSSRPPSDSPPTRIAAALTGSTPAGDALESSSDSPITRTATTLSRSTPVGDSPESIPETAEAQQVDPPVKSPPTSHKIYRKVRSWLGSLPRRLRQN
jgi:LPXTG-site transpeptidase (sortase) family protein